MTKLESRRSEALAAPKPRRRLSRMPVSALVSLLLHALVFLALLTTIRQPPHEEMLPPPADVTMLFETGTKKGPRVPNPSPQTLSIAPPAPAAPAPPLPVPPAPTPSVPPVAKAPEATQAPVPPPNPAEPKPEPAPPPPPPAERTPEPAPLPPPPPPPRPVERKPPKPPREPRQATKPPATQKTPEFPMPENFSFGAPRSGTRSQPRPTVARSHLPGTIDMTLGPESRGALDTTPRSEHDIEVAGADWRNAFSRWVSDHAYYPPQAKANFEEGDARVHVVVNPATGEVKSVELTGKSGSVWLDLAIQSLFRDQRIPPLPPGTENPFEFDFVMHYILIRVR